MHRFSNKVSLSDKAKQVIVFAALALLLVGAQRINAGTTYTDPTQDPPLGQVTAPLTVGVSSTTVQDVAGALTMDGIGVFGNALIEGYASIGTSTPPTNPDTTLLVDGNVAANEFCDPTGTVCFEADTVVNILNETDDSISCPLSPDYSSMIGGPGTGGYFNIPANGENGYFGASSIGSNTAVDKWDITTMDSSCKIDTGVGCIIREKIYRRYPYPGYPSNWYQDKLYAVRDFEYRQDTTPAGTTAEQLWWSSYLTAGTLKNGDTKSSNVIRPFSYLFLRDDGNVAGAETDNDKFSAYDYTRAYGFEIYFCSETAL